MENNRIYNLKIVHHFYDSGDNVSNYPIEVSVELISNYNSKNDFLDWKKSVTFVYFDVNDKKIINKEETLYDKNIINEIENMNLKGLKNNYFTDSIPESFSYWEIQYNYNFKIVGTYDNETYEYKRISELLDFNSTIRNMRDQL